jgi:hypothetical protein
MRVRLTTVNDPMALLEDAIDELAQALPHREWKKWWKSQFGVTARNAAALRIAILDRFSGYKPSVAAVGDRGRDEGVGPDLVIATFAAELTVARSAELGWTVSRACRPDATASEPWERRSWVTRAGQVAPGVASQPKNSLCNSWTAAERAAHHAAWFASVPPPAGLRELVAAWTPKLIEVNGTGERAVVEIDGQRVEVLDTGRKTEHLEEETRAADGTLKSVIVHPSRPIWRRLDNGSLIEGSPVLIYPVVRAPVVEWSFCPTAPLDRTSCQFLASVPGPGPFASWRRSWSTDRQVLRKRFGKPTGRADGPYGAPWVFRHGESGPVATLYTGEGRMFRIGARAFEDAVSLLRWLVGTGAVQMEADAIEDIEERHRIEEANLEQRRAENMASRQQAQS